MDKNIDQRVANKIYFIRGHRVMLDSDLADLYGVETKVLNQAVRRNADRFPSDFMFRVEIQELANLRSQFVTSSLGGYGGRRYGALAFTEQGIAMLSTVLKSSQAIQVNIEIMRAFVRLREILLSHKDLSHRLDELEKKYDSQFRGVFEAIRRLMAAPEGAKRRVGFKW